MNKIIADVAEEGGAVFVDGYNLVPHDFDHLIDHVHLNDQGCQVLGEAIAKALLDDPRFADLVARVRTERNAPVK